MHLKILVKRKIEREWVGNMKTRFLIICFLCLLPIAAQAGIVNNSGDTAADSIGFTFTLMDTLGNPVAATTGDSIWIFLKYPNGGLIMRDSARIISDSRITTTLLSTLQGDWAEYHLADAVANWDGVGLDGVFTLSWIATDSTLGLATSGKTEFQLFQDQDFNAGFANLDTPVSTRLAPTTSGRTLDVTAGGAAGIDWGNVENPTTANNLSTTQMLSVTAAAVISAGGITANSFATDAITADKIAANAIGASEIASGAIVFGTEATGFFNYSSDTVSANVTQWAGGTGVVLSLSEAVDDDDSPTTWELNIEGNLAGSVTSVTGDVGIDAGSVDDIWNEAQSGHTTAGTFGKYLDSEVSGASTFDASTDEVQLDNSQGDITWGRFYVSGGLQVDNSYDDQAAFLIGAPSTYSAMHLSVGGVTTGRYGLQVSQGVNNVPAIYFDGAGTGGGRYAISYGNTAGMNFGTVNAALAGFLGNITGNLSGSVGSVTGKVTLVDSSANDIAMLGNAHPTDSTNMATAAAGADTVIAHAPHDDNWGGTGSGNDDYPAIFATVTIDTSYGNTDFVVDSTTLVTAGGVVELYSLLSHPLMFPQHFGHTQMADSVRNNANGMIEFFLTTGDSLDVETLADGDTVHLLTQAYDVFPSVASYAAEARDTLLGTDTTLYTGGYEDIGGAILGALLSGVASSSPWTSAGVDSVYDWIKAANDSAFIAKLNDLADSLARRSELATTDSLRDALGDTFTVFIDSVQNAITDVNKANFKGSATEVFTQAGADSIQAFMSNPDVNVTEIAGNATSATVLDEAFDGDVTPAGLVYSDVIYISGSSAAADSLEALALANYPNEFHDSLSTQAWATSGSGSDTAAMSAWAVSAGMNLARDATADDYKYAGGGTGANSVTFYVRDTTNDVRVANAVVTIKSTDETTTHAGPIPTSANGVASLSLDDGDYVALVTANNVTFATDTFTVSGVTVDSTIGYGQTTTSPPTSAYATAFGTLIGAGYPTSGSEAKAQGWIVRFTLEEPKAELSDTLSNKVIVLNTVDVYPDANGYVEVYLLKTGNMLYKSGSQYKEPTWRMRASPSDVEVDPRVDITFKIPSDSTTIDIGLLLEQAAD